MMDRRITVVLSATGIKRLTIVLWLFIRKNGGLSDARNAAIPLAKGEYISFIDSDDWVSSYYVEHLYEAVAKCDADIGISWFENVFEEKALQSKPEEPLSNYECLTAEECLKKLLYQNGVEVCAWGKTV